MKCPSCELEFDEADIQSSRLTLRRFRCPICGEKLRYDFRSAAAWILGIVSFCTGFAFPRIPIGLGYDLQLAIMSIGLISFVYGLCFRRLVRLHS